MKRLLERRRRARSRVHLVQQPRADYGAGGGIGSKQVAEVTLPREELDEVWSAEHLERFARTYWRFLTRVSLGLLRVLYTDTSREVVLLELAVDYNATLRVEEADGDATRLVVDLPLEGLQH